MTLRTRMLMFTVILACAAGSFAQEDWSGWNVVRGGLDIEYRWRLRSCQPVGCFKDVEFRNNSKETVAFTYTIWSEGLKDKGDEVSTTGVTAVSPQSKSSAVTGSGGQKVVRVSIERRSQRKSKRQGRSEPLRSSSASVRDRGCP